MSNELERLWKEAALVQFMEQFRNLPEATVEYHETPRSW
jgi:hypothetical protein